jgi:hypothetical protein
MVNLENSSEIHKTLCELLSAAGEDLNSLDSPKPPPRNSPNGSEGSGGSQQTAAAKGGLCLNHDQCHDCSYVQMITSDCINHLNLLTKQTVDASQRLLQLVELRERVLILLSILPSLAFLISSLSFSAL